MSSEKLIIQKGNFLRQLQHFDSYFCINFHELTLPEIVFYLFLWITGSKKKQQTIQLYKYQLYG